MSHVMRSALFTGARASSLIALCAAAAAATGAHAQTPVFGNFGAEATNAQSVVLNVNNVASVRFATGAQSVLISSVQVSLSQVFSQSSTGFAIFSNSSGNPGSELFSFGTRTIDNPSDTSQDYTFSTGGSFLLQANTVYHLRNVTTNGEEVFWKKTNPATAPTALNGSGITYQDNLFTPGFGNPYFPTQGNLRFQLAGPAVEIPESSTFALALPALALIGAVLVRRRKK